MDNEISLPNSQYIDIDLGLKYLNGNKKLYLKILTSFFTRYKDFDIYQIEENEFKNEMHSLKGLSSTLGMESLSELTKILHTKSTEDLLMKFSETLKLIIKDLDNTQTNTLLIIEDNSDNIDYLIKILENKYAIMVSTTPNDDLDSLTTEEISIALVSLSLSTSELINKLEQKNISIIKLHEPIEINNLLLAINNLQN